MAPGCFSQSTNSKETMPLKQTSVMTSPVKLQPMARAVRPSTPPLRNSKRASIDSFEILEQTIMKQKRLAKLKNTDLRKKVLLKRTFDLICDIMDTENGFTENDDAEPSTPMVSSSTINVDAQEPETIELELELHDHSKMDEYDEEQEEEPMTPIKSSDEEADSQVLPRQAKRRASSDDEDEEETVFCESYLSDQQLNWRRSFEASAAAVELKIYSDDSSNETSPSSTTKSRRTDHQRSAKRIRAH